MTVLHCLSFVGDQDKKKKKMLHSQLVEEHLSNRWRVASFFLKDLGVVEDMELHD